MKPDYGPTAEFGILEESRLIQAIGFEAGGGWSIEGGFAIKPYLEYGEMAAITWLHVTKDGETIARVPARLVSIVY